MSPLPGRTADTLAIEKAEGFDRAGAEMALDDWTDSRHMGGLEIFYSRVPGVLAFERFGRGQLDEAGRLTELAAHLKEATGKDVVCVAPCDWSFDDRCDEEAVLVAFDIPSLPEDYRTDPRNVLEIEQEPELAPGV